MFTFDYTVRMADTDASGFLFFTSPLRMAHEAYEAFMKMNGLGIGSILKEADYLLPIVHAEIDNKATSFVDGSLSIEVSAERIGDTSFTLAYRLVSQDGRHVGSAMTTHVAIDAAHQKRGLPAPLRAALETL